MFKDIMELVFLENRITDYLIFVGLFLAAFGMIKIFQYFIIKNLKKWAEKTATTIDDFLLEIKLRYTLTVTQQIVSGFAALQKKRIYARAQH